MPVIGVTTVESIVAEVNPPGPVQLQWVAPVALPDRINVVPGHRVVRLAVAVTPVGMVVAFTTTLVLADAVHELAAVTVTVYINVPGPYVVALNGAGDAPVPEYPLLQLQLYELPPVALRTIIPSVQ